MHGQKYGKGKHSQRRQTEINQRFQPLPRRHIGIDEAGRGCLAGPVVAAAVLFPEDFDFTAGLPGLTDSKKLRPAKREALAGLAAQASVAYGLGFSWQDEIDGINILNATFRAMARAVFCLALRLRQGPERERSLPPLVIDGNKTIPEAQWRHGEDGIAAGAPSWAPEAELPAGPAFFLMPPLPEQYAVVDADALIPSVSAASVLAKTARDGIMERLDALYPGYGMARHKGYGTRQHLTALAGKGPSWPHRKSFRGVLPQERQLELPGAVSR